MELKSNAQESRGELGDLPVRVASRYSYGFFRGDAFQMSDGLFVVESLSDLIDVSQTSQVSRRLCDDSPLRARERPRAGDR